MESFTTEILFLLAMVALVAGAVDAIAGGGGLLVLPVLLATGMTPVEALATNKLQGSFGTFSASAHFVYHGSVSLRKLAPAIILTFVGSALGTLGVVTLDQQILQWLVPVLLILFSLYFVFSPHVSDHPRPARISLVVFALTAAFSIGFYDGFFGPGAGSFFTIAFVFLLGYGLTAATANTKILNFTSNITALVFFALSGEVVWLVGLTMAAGQFAGGWIGSHLVIRHGSTLIRPLLVLVSLAISGKLIMAQLT